MFRAAGYTADGVPAQLPSAPVELWRGSVPERRRDWSWTASLAVAQGYAAGTAAVRPAGKLYRTVAPPSALLAYNSGREEDEYVVDTRGLRISEAGLLPAAPVG
ncbi:hypothetical protein OG871_39680 (plasmid) [Kitasatospora sp. NBC_00374]|uniref:hypothetical protein n=1 Tax=Kitasatospora sp. NBC_00374 TaxID=2975964 RepID=UPI002F9080BE